MKHKNNKPHKVRIQRRRQRKSKHVMGWTYGHSIAKEVVIRRETDNEIFDTLRQ